MDVIEPIAAYTAATASFDDWLARTGDWVELPNERRGGYSGVQRIQEGSTYLYRKHQINHCYRSWQHPLGEPTILREQRALQAFTALGVKVPHVLYCAARKRAGTWEALLVTEALQGFESLERIRELGLDKTWSPELRHNLFYELGASLARLHTDRWQHGCLYPKHIFLRVSPCGQHGELALLDLEKSRQRWSAHRAAQHDLTQLRRRSVHTPEDWEAVEQGYQSVMGPIPPQTTKY
ncbi:lipopolysaccharide kinase (Kdo/WaaP) family protein [Azomonas agilis]|uniref:Lipopolysaccharide kinase (Kdo/WaaP) family protein n=1 Tax=Azomonas agilis TaxID=116849 RepID=A0A562J1U7_9GAMM|nr:lipopolysaccharide kinase InaA family protein [Azomonas agilis]TWH77239.1 lipopolysaccharide kinase (Kdo/WaaP) family protein [Azomonas agilis]